MSVKYQDQLTKWDEWIRTGHASKVRTLSRQLNHKKIPRPLLVDYAQIARRVGAPDLILLWLGPIVRSEKKMSWAATDQEKAIYGLGLFRLGAFHEAETILSEINPEIEPQVYFYRASLNMNQWNYAKAIPDLKKYIANKKVAPYQRLVGHLNLCASLVSNIKKDPKQIEYQIHKLMSQLDQADFPLLKGNLLEIRSQWLYEKGELKNALADLDKASQILRKADEQSLIYIDKWKLIIQLKDQKNSKNLVSQFDDLKKRAIDAKNWETVRDCDLQKALTLKDSNLILKVYWGSKFSAYKKRVRHLYPSLVVDNTFSWKNSDRKDLPSFNLIESAPTKTLRKLFFILLSEMYQPLRSTEIIDSLYPNEYYHPATSPARLHRLIARARKWLQENQIPVQIQAFRNAYRLKQLTTSQIILSSQMAAPKIVLPELVQQEFFRAKDWAKQKNVSERTARKQILSLVRQGLIESFVRGPKTKYRLKKN
ncbi:MAG: hypothetical protein H7256_02670 [Bdellovibrio sp.]|nr:hypothetical protein [Bdellovibrio sp.]